MLKIIIGGFIVGFLCTAAFAQEKQSKQQDVEKSGEYLEKDSSRDNGNISFSDELRWCNLDYNEDGELSTEDIRLAQLILGGEARPLDPEEFELDLQGNGGFTAFDLVLFAGLLNGTYDAEDFPNCDCFDHFEYEEGHQCWRDPYERVVLIEAKGIPMPAPEYLNENKYSYNLDEMVITNYFISSHFPNREYKPECYFQSEVIDINAELHAQKLNQTGVYSLGNLNWYILDYDLPPGRRFNDLLNQSVLDLTNSPFYPWSNAYPMDGNYFGNSFAISMDMDNGSIITHADTDLPQTSIFGHRRKMDVPEPNITSRRIEINGNIENLFPVSDSQHAILRQHIGTYGQYSRLLPGVTVSLVQYCPRD